MSESPAGAGGNGGDGKPVAWQVVDAHGNVLPHWGWVSLADMADAKETCELQAQHINALDGFNALRPYSARPLYLRSPASPDARPSQTAADVIEQAVQGLPDAGMDGHTECVMLPALMAWPAGEESRANLELSGNLTVAVPAAKLHELLCDALDDEQAEVSPPDTRRTREGEPLCAHGTPFELDCAKCAYEASVKQRAAVRDALIELGNHTAKHTQGWIGTYSIDAWRDEHYPALTESVSSPARTPKEG